MANHKELDVEWIRANYRYDGFGGLTWRVPDERSTEYLLPIGYFYAYVGERLIPVQRIVWALHNGDPGNLDIDHIDQDKLNNKIENLRALTRSENMQNQTEAQSNNKTSGVRGVYRDSARRKWAAKITVNGKDIMIGRFYYIENAIAARQDAERKYHPYAPINKEAKES